MDRYADGSNHSAPIKSTATSMDFIRDLGRSSRRMQEILRHHSPTRQARIGTRARDSAFLAALIATKTRPPDNPGKEAPEPTIQEQKKAYRPARDRATTPAPFPREKTSKNPARNPPPRVTRSRKRRPPARAPPSIHPRSGNAAPESPGKGRR